MLWVCDDHLRPAVTWHGEPPAVPPARTRSPSPGRIAPAAEPPEDFLQAPARAWIRWSEPGPLAAQAYFAFGFQLMGRAADSTRQNPRTSIYLPDLDLTFSVPSDMAAGGINAGQAEQMALSRAPVVVDPPWSGKTGHNQYGDPLPYTAAQSLTRGDFPEGDDAMHHLGPILPADEQPQPGSPRSVPLAPEATRAETESPLTPVEPTAPDLQALGDYMSARPSGRSAQDALDAGAMEGQAPGDVRHMPPRGISTPSCRAPGSSSWWSSSTQWLACKPPGHGRPRFHCPHPSLRRPQVCHQFQLDARLPRRQRRRASPLCSSGPG